MEIFSLTLWVREKERKFTDHRREIYVHGKTRLSMSFPKSRKTHLRLTFYATRLSVLCFYAGSNMLRSRAENKIQHFHSHSCFSRSGENIACGFLVRVLISFFTLLLEKLIFIVAARG